MSVPAEHGRCSVNITTLTPFPEHQVSLPAKQVPFSPRLLRVPVGGNLPDGRHLGGGKATRLSLAELGGRALASHLGPDCCVTSGWSPHLSVKSVVWVGNVLSAHPEGCLCTRPERSHGGPHAKARPPAI